jgi:hypothetical protein
LDAIKPTYPLIAIADRAIVVHPEEGALAVVSRRALDSGHVGSVKLIDMAGQTFRIESFDVAKEWYWNRPKTPFGRGVRLNNIGYAHLGHTSLVELKQVIRESVEADHDLWAARGDVPSLLRDIDAAADIPSP